LDHHSHQHAANIMSARSSQPSPTAGVKRSPESPSDRENEHWTGEDSDDGSSHPDVSRKRVKKDHDSHRPVSVSCETCKLRKVFGLELYFNVN
jgi:hypothetical protein